MRPLGRRPAAVLGSALVGALAMALPGAGALAQVTVLRGELLDRDGRPAEGVRILIVGQPPEVVVRDGGTFAHPLTGSPSEVTVRVVGSPGVDVLFPPGGRVVVPRDPDAVVPVLVGETLDAAVRERIESDLTAIRETLALRGVADDQIEAAVAAEMDGLVARIEEITRGAVEGAVAGAEQVDLRERLNRNLSAYVRAAADLVRVFGLLDPDQELGPARFQLLYGTMDRYSHAYAALDEEVASMPPALERAWPGSHGRVARRALEDFLGVVRVDFHQKVLDLTVPLDVIQRRYLAGPRPGAGELRDAKQAIQVALPDLAAVAPRLRTQASDILAALGPSTGG